MEKNFMLEQALSIPSLIRELYQEAERRTHLILSTPEIFETRQLILFGCGDSLAAAEGAEYTFSRLTAIPTRAVPAMEASRYLAPTLSQPAKRILAIGISNSGAPARMIEAMTALSAHGARTVALTGKTDSPMARAAKTVLEVSAPPFSGEAPGIRGYAAAQLTLYLLAIRFGEVLGTISMNQAAALRKSLLCCADVLEGALKSCEDPFRAFAVSLSGSRQAEFLGSGPCRASAGFAAAKMVEAVGTSAWAQDTEEFAHLNLFLRDPMQTPTILFAPSADPSFSRCKEVFQALQVLGRPTLMLTDGAAQDGALSISAKPIDPLFVSLVYSCLSGFLVSMVDGGPDCAYFRAHSGPWSEKEYPDVRSSQIQLF